MESTSPVTGLPHLVQFQCSEKSQPDLPRLKMEIRCNFSIKRKVLPFSVSLGIFPSLESTIHIHYHFLDNFQKEKFKNKRKESGNKKKGKQRGEVENQFNQAANLNIKSRNSIPHIVKRRESGSKFRALNHPVAALVTVCGLEAPKLDI